MFAFIAQQIAVGALICFVIYASWLHYQEMKHIAHRETVERLKAAIDMDHMER